MLGLGLSWTGQVAGASGGPGSWLSRRLEWQECCRGLCSEYSQTPMDFGISQPLLLPLGTSLLPPEMAQTRETPERSCALADDGEDGSLLLPMDVARMSR